MPVALVTGGAGLIGSHLVDLLVAEGWLVRVVDSLDAETHPVRSHGDGAIDDVMDRVPGWLNPQAHYLFAGVDSSRLARLLVGVDVVFHQAAYGGFSPHASRMTHTNALGTAQVMDAAHNAGVKRVVVASSQAVYGNGRYRCIRGHGTAGGWAGTGSRSPAYLERRSWEVRCPSCDGPTEALRAREDDPVDLPSPYALSKFYAERLALTLGAQWGLPVVALRYALTYGPRQSVTNPYTGIASMFAARLAAGLVPTIHEDGLQTRDFTYVEDVAAANLVAATHDDAPGRALNVGTGKRTSVILFADTLRGALDDRGAIPAKAWAWKWAWRIAGTYRPADARHTAVSNRNMRALGWEPKVQLADGLARYADWFLEHGRDEAQVVGVDLETPGIVRMAQ